MLPPISALVFLLVWFIVFVLLFNFSCNIGSFLGLNCGYDTDLAGKIWVNLGQCKLLRSQVFWFIFAWHLSVQDILIFWKVIFITDIFRTLVKVDPNSLVYDKLATVTIWRKIIHVGKRWWWRTCRWICSVSLAGSVEGNLVQVMKGLKLRMYWVPLAMGSGLLLCAVWGISCFNQCEGTMSATCP